MISQKIFQINDKNKFTNLKVNTLLIKNDTQVFF